MRNIFKNISYSIVGLLLVVAAVLYAQPKVYAYNDAYFTVSPTSGSYQAGDSLVFNVSEYSSSGDNTDAVQVNLSYSANLQFNNTSLSGPFTICAQNSGGGGSVALGCASASRESGTSAIAQISFTVIGSGTASISLTSGSHIVAQNGSFVDNGLLPSVSLQTTEPQVSPYSWDPGLFATYTTPDFNQVHAWGQRKTGGAWGTGPVNYQSGATESQRSSAPGSLSVELDGTYCPNGVCSYGSGTGYKGLVQFWNDPADFIAFGLIHDPGVSPTGTTLMIEGAAYGKPIGGYWASNAITGTTHTFSFTWTSSTISVTLDNHVNLGTYNIAASDPSISFLAAARQTGDICDTTFNNISLRP